MISTVTIEEENSGFDHRHTGAFLSGGYMLSPWVSLDCSVFCFLFCKLSQLTIKIPIIVTHCILSKTSLLTPSQLGLTPASKQWKDGWIDGWTLCHLLVMRLRLASYCNRQFKKKKEIINFLIILSDLLWKNYEN